MKKFLKNILPVILLFWFFEAGASGNETTDGFTIIEAKGWLESAFVKWNNSVAADSYNVYYIGSDQKEVKIDAQLVRNYGSFFRADVLGLVPGEYKLKIVPVAGGNEIDGLVTDKLQVLAQDRSGFAFKDNKVPGAYKSDGSLKDKARVIYITENNKNKIQLEVTGASANPCTGLQAILDGYKKGKDTRPLAVRLIGQITDPAVLYNGDIVIENDNNSASYITLEGVGDDAVADGWGIRIKNASNIEIRNIATMNCNSDEGDNIGLQQNNDHIWVHNCDFFYGEAGSDADQVKGDGALDCKKSTYVTFSYNHFWDSGKSNLLGLSEGTTSGLFITYHHNWYDHSDSRHPRIRYYTVHVYNNYYDGVSKYGVGATTASSAFVESNYFRNCKYPMLISMQGSDVYDETKQANDYSSMPTFSKENGGMIKAYNNFMTGQKRFVPYGASGFPKSNVDFDAYVASTRNEKVDKSIITYQGKTAYNNFDTDSTLIYSYSPDDPETAKANVVKYAGRIDGGDFKWIFNNAIDDISYDVNIALKSALKSYKTKLVSVQGETTTYISKVTETTTHLLYPNPAKDILYVSKALSVRSIKVYNLKGYEVLSAPSGSSEINISTLKSGVYLIKINSDIYVFEELVVKK
jgi:pectate lyase